MSKAQARRDARAMVMMTLAEILQKLPDGAWVTARTVSDHITSLTYAQVAGALTALNRDGGKVLAKRVSDVCVYRLRAQEGEPRSEGAAR